MAVSNCRHGSEIATGAARVCEGKELNMLWTVFVVLMILWLLGLVSGYTLSGFIHVLLVVALAAVLIRVIQGRSPL
jgi:hypothetical protein